MSFSYVPGRSKSTFGKHLGSLYSDSVLKEVDKNTHANTNTVEKAFSFCDYSAAPVKGIYRSQAAHWPGSEREGRGMGLGRQKEPTVSTQSWSF